MKKYFIFLPLLIAVLFVDAQQSYKYVIIPTQFSNFADGFNPYGLSSSLQTVFTEKGIKNVFQGSEVPEDYCEALTVNLVKMSSMFRNKLEVELKDCRNMVVWSHEGTGLSKDFREGFGEAIAEALKDLDTLPKNRYVTEVKEPMAPKPAKKEETPTPVHAEKQQVPVNDEIAEKANQQETIYKPENLFYNYTYFLDLVEKENGKKELIVINGALLGYQNLQPVATLIPSGLDQVFTVNWVDADGGTIRGVANLTGSDLKLSLPDGDDMKVIHLQRY